MSHEKDAAPAETGSSQTSSSPTKGPQRRISGLKSAYLWGAASGVALAIFAPMLRPAARSAVKAGIKVGRHAKKVGSSLKEEFEDIAAEAQADLDRQNSAEKPQV